MINRVIKVVLAAVLFTAVLEAKGPDAKVVIDKMITAYGGEANLKKLNSYEQVWHIETKTSNKNGSDHRTVKMPGYLQTQLTYPDKTEIRTLKNGIGIKEFGKRKLEVKGPMLDAMRLQLMRLFNPLILKSKIQGITTSEKDSFYIIYLSDGSITTEYFVSKKSFLIEKVVGRLKMGHNKMEFLTVYEDYKSENGVMIAHKEIKYAAKVNTAVMRLKATKFTTAK